MSYINPKLPVEEEIWNTVLVLGLGAALVTVLIAHPGML